MVGSRKRSVIETGFTLSFLLVSSIVAECIEPELGETLRQRARSAAAVDCSNRSEGPKTFLDDDVDDDRATSKKRWL